MALVGSGVIGPGGSESFGVVLQGGHHYSVYVRPTEPSVDFDLFVYDERDNLVGVDADPAPDAYCGLSPAWTGPFRLEVHSHRGLSDYQIVVQE